MLLLQLRRILYLCKIEGLVFFVFLEIETACGTSCRVNSSHLKSHVACQESCQLVDSLALVLPYYTRYLVQRDPDEGVNQENIDRLSCLIKVHI